MAEDATIPSYLKRIATAVETAASSDAGDATAAKQDTGNTSLASIDTKLTTLAGYVDGLETLATALNGYVDGLEASLPMTNTQFLANMRSTAAFTSVNSAATSTNILASNANRKGAVIVNTDANTLYLDLTGGTAAVTRYAVALATGQSYQVPFGITGLITGIWAADGAGAALVTEAS